MRQEVFVGAKHFFLMRQPDKFIGLLRDWLTGTPLDGDSTIPALARTAMTSRLFAPACGRVRSPLRRVDLQIRVRCLDFRKHHQSGSHGRHTRESVQRDVEASGADQVAG